MKSLNSPSPAAEAWPSLPYEAWKDTYATLHMWTQIVGKIRLAQAPHVNHWWQVPLYVTASGLTTSAMPHGNRFFQIDFDFVAHRLTVRTNEGKAQSIQLAPSSVADFYAEMGTILKRLDVPVRIWSTPVEVEVAVPFEEQTSPGAYDAEAAERFWRALAQGDRVLQAFRGRFLGKSSPVHFFWGSFDLAVTRFSGRTAPPHPGGIPNLADWVTREAYSHEVHSAGWWPGGTAMPEPIFYAYAYPEPAGFSDFPVGPTSAYYHPTLREFVLPYDAARQAPDPDRALTEFLQTSYEAAAERGGWEREALEVK